MALTEYRKKRDFKVTSEPAPRPLRRKRSSGLSFVVQKHHASHLHYDFRLELDGVLKSWAVPKGPSLDPHVKRLAMEVEDHPIDYAGFEGTIPKGEYGAGEVIVWDRGSWAPLSDARKGLRAGRLEFTLAGEKLGGNWVLVRTRPAGKRHQWLLIKRTDRAARSEAELDIAAERPESVISGKELGEAGETLKRRAIRKTPARAAARKSASTKKPAKKGSIGFEEPQLAKLVAEPPSGDGWAHEIKFDGYRTLIRLNSSKATFFTRSGLDWSKKYASLQPSLGELQATSAWIDGEICVVDEEGRTSFHALQAELSRTATKKLIYYAFDLLEVDGEDLRAQPLRERKARLKRLLDTAPSDRIVYSDHFEGSGKSLHEASCERGLEGILSKRLDSPYRSGRQDTWLKSKCHLEQEFVIAGYSLSDRGNAFKSLLLGVYDGVGKNRLLRSVGRVGTGFDRKEIRALIGKLTPLHRSRAPFAEPISPGNRWRAADRVQWVDPVLLAQVEFRGWTGDRQVRQASFKGLREDKRPRDIVVEAAAPLPRPSQAALTLEARAARSAPARRSRRQQPSIHDPVKLSHPDKVLIPDVGVTKLDLVRYYRLVEKRILPQVVDRPLSLLRCPDGIRAQCFFQKNLYSYHPPQLETEDSVGPKGANEHLMYIESVEGLEALAQYGVVEVHTRGAHRDHPNAPDLVVFDLDPSPGVPWKTVVEATYLVRDILDRLGLRSFVKTSGGKGFHVHVPIAPLYTWEQVKEFSKTVAVYLSKENPKLFVATVRKSTRGGKIFVDYLRNGFGATSVAPYAVRARPGAPIAMPIRWEDVSKVRSDQFRLMDLLEDPAPLRVDPWKGYADCRQEIGILAER